ncbi:MAG: biotin/lipoyl-binding protein [Bryobacteraceae bacterium]
MKLYLGSLICLALFLAGCSGEQKKAEAASTKTPEPITVQTVAAESRVLDKTLSVTGSLHPDETMSASAEVPGTVTRILVDFGQPVRKGQVVAELDRRELNLQTERSKAAMAQALARLALNLRRRMSVPNRRLPFARRRRKWKMRVTSTKTHPVW